MNITLITGAANGLGKEFSYIFAKEKNNLLLIDVDEEALKFVKNDIECLYPDIVVKILIKDLSKKNELDDIYLYTLNNNYFVNNLINCAGFGDKCDFIKMDINNQLLMNDVNCNAYLYLMKVFLNDMLKNNSGHILNVSSMAGFIPGPYMSTYHATKGYLILLGEAISYELRKTNIKLLTLCPGPFLSKFVLRAHNDYTFSKLSPNYAKDVATYGYKKLMRGKKIAIVGFKNKFIIFLTRFVPRSLVTKFSAKIIKKEKP